MSAEIHKRSTRRRRFAAVDGGLVGRTAASFIRNRIRRLLTTKSEAKNGGSAIAPEGKCRAIHCFPSRFLSSISSTTPCRPSFIHQNVNW